MLWMGINYTSPLALLQSVWLSYQRQTLDMASQGDFTDIGPILERVDKTKEDMDTMEDVAVQVKIAKTFWNSPLPNFWACKWNNYYAGKPTYSTTLVRREMDKKDLKPLSVPPEKNHRHCQGEINHDEKRGNPDCLNYSLVQVPQPSQIFCGVADQYFWRRNFIHHMKNALFTVLGSFVNLVVYMDHSKSGIRDESIKTYGRWLEVELPQFNYVGEILDSTSTVYCTTTITDPTVIKKYPSFQTERQPGGIFVFLNSILQSRRIFTEISEDARLWCLRRSLVVDYLKIDGEDRMCIFMDKNLVYHQILEMQEMLDLPDSYCFMSDDRKRRALRNILPPEAHVPTPEINGEKEEEINLETNISG